MRLDKWLWCARFFKTRAIAQKHYFERVEVNNSIAKPSKIINCGDKIILKFHLISLNLQLCQYLKIEFLRSY